MKDKINSYFAVLLITIAGAGATLLITHIAEVNTFGVSTGDNEASYAELQQSILQQ